MPALITIESVEFGYPGADGFRLTVPSLVFDADEHCAIIGPSGCGKTTLLNLIAGVLRPASGLISNQNVTVSNLDDKARRAFRIKNVGLVFQAFELLDYLNVRDNVLLPYRLHRDMSLDDEVKARAAMLIESVGLGGKLNRSVDQLSQGEQQRVAVARALVTKPPLLLADEPTGNLDPDNKVRIIDLLQSAAEQTHSTIITVTHDHSLLDRFDRIIEFDTIRS
jgi:putative ABC transport system ATP-binding protein